MFKHRSELNITVIYFQKYEQTSDICFIIVRSQIVSKSVSKRQTFILPL